LNRGRRIWVGVDECFLEEGFDYQFFHRHRGGLGSTSSKATTVARGEREKRGQGGWEQPSERGEWAVMVFMAHVLDASRGLALFPMRATTFPCCARRRQSCYERVCLSGKVFPTLWSVRCGPRFSRRASKWMKLSPLGVRNYPNRPTVLEKSYKNC
jgi:hypothetical protein